MREIVGADAVTDGKAQSIAGVRVLGPYRLQIRLTKPLGDFTARLTHAVLLPGPAEHARRSARDRRSGRLGPVLRRRARREPAHRAEAQPVLPRRTPGERRPDGLDDSARASGRLPARGRAGPGRLLRPYRALHETPGAALAGKYGHQSARRPALRQPQRSRRWYLAFNHDRPAFQGTGPDPAQEGDQLRASTGLRWCAPSATSRGKRTDQLLPPALARAASIYPLGGADVVARRNAGTRGRASSRRSSSSTRPTAARRSVEVAQTLAFNLKQIGIDLEVKYFDTRRRWREKAATPGEPFDLVMLGLGSRLRRRGVVLRAAARTGTAIRSGVNLDDARLQRRIDAANRLTGEARRRGLGRPRRRPDARQPALGAVHAHSIAHRSSPAASAASSSTRSSRFDITALCKKP